MTGLGRRFQQHPNDTPNDRHPQPRFSVRRLGCNAPTTFACLGRINFHAISFSSRRDVRRHS